MAKKKRREQTQKTYRVQYEIDIEADSPQEAAAQAYDFMKHGEAPVVDVVEYNGRDLPVMNDEDPYYDCAFKYGERIDLELVLREEDDDEEI